MDKVKERLTIFIICAAILLIGFVVFRFVLFGMHGMKEWPFDLFVAGIVLSLIGAVLKGYFTCCFTVVGYIMGFALGMNVLGENAWLIWLAVFAGGAVLGILLDIVTRLKGKSR